MVSDKIYKITSKHRESIELMQGWYIEQQSAHHSIKISWLRGMMKKEHYDGHERNMLNKMVKKYNKRLV